MLRDASRIWLRVLILRFSSCHVCDSYSYKWYGRPWINNVSVLQLQMLQINYIINVKNECSWVGTRLSASASLMSAFIFWFFLFLRLWDSVGASSALDRHIRWHGRWIMFGGRVIKMSWQNTSRTAQRCGGRWCWNREIRIDRESNVVHAIVRVISAMAKLIETHLCCMWWIFR